MEALTVALIAFAVTQVVKTVLIEVFEVSLLSWVKQALVLVISGAVAWTLALGAWVALGAVGIAFLLHAVFRTLFAIGDAKRIEVMKATRRV